MSRERAMGQKRELKVDPIPPTNAVPFTSTEGT
jgi:hypothetical protein